MKKYILLPLIACLVGCDSRENLNQQAFCEELELRLSCKNPEYEQGSLFKEKVEIINNATNEVVLVFPGDGSASHWRTPLTGVSILSLDSEEKHPNFPPAIDATCGNINDLKKGEVFILKPGEKQEIDMWRSLFPICNLDPGKYRLILYYINDPKLKWEGVPLDKHDEEEMGKIRKSTPCKLMSNEIILTITGKLDNQPSEVVPQP